MCGSGLELAGAVAVADVDGQANPAIVPGRALISVLAQPPPNTSPTPSCPSLALLCCQVPSAGLLWSADTLAVQEAGAVHPTQTWATCLQW